MQCGAEKTSRVANRVAAKDELQRTDIRSEGGRNRDQTGRGDKEGIETCAPKAGANGEEPMERKTGVGVEL